MTTFNPDSKDPSKLRRISTIVAATSSAGPMLGFRGKPTELHPASARGPNGNVLVSETEVVPGVPTADQLQVARVDAEYNLIDHKKVADARRPPWAPPARTSLTYEGAAKGPNGEVLSRYEEDTLANVPDVIDPNAEPILDDYVSGGPTTVVRRYDDLDPLYQTGIESMWHPATKVTANDNTRGTRPSPYTQLKEANDLVGGWRDFVGNSAPRGVFANYSGSTRKFNSNPQTTQTMARLAIPVAGDAYDFITKSGLGDKLGGLANSIIIQGNSGLGYIDFLLQHVQESLSEKVQISDTIGDNYASFFFGMNPPTFSFAGQLMNTYQDDWRMAFHLLYRNLLRGTMLARYNKIISLYYDNIIVNGYMLNHSQNFTADMQMASTFSFNLLVKSMTLFRLPGTMPTPADKLPANVGFKTLTGLQRSSIKRTTRTVGDVLVAEENPNKEPLTPQEAQGRLEALRADYEYQARLLSSPEEREQMGLDDPPVRFVQGDGKPLTPQGAAQLSDNSYRVGGSGSGRPSRG